MRFIDDHGVGARQQLAEPVVLQREIGEQQVMVDDDDFCRLCTAARLDDEAAIDELALAAEAIVDRRRDLRAQRVIVGQVLELRQVAARARLAPRVERPQRATVVASRVPSRTAASSRCQHR